MTTKFYRLIHHYQEQSPIDASIVIKSRLDAETFAMWLRNIEHINIQAYDFINGVCVNQDAVNGHLYEHRKILNDWIRSRGQELINLFYS